MKIGIVSEYIKAIIKFKAYLVLILMGVALQLACRQKNNHAENTTVSKLETEAKAKSTIKLSLDIPQKVIELRKYIIENGKTKEGYVGGRKFKNLEKRLPKFDSENKRINYQEWDVNKKINGKNRGRERLITGSDGNDYYTNDHYNSFKLLPKLVLN
jgi:ribonuclease T1